MKWVKNIKIYDPLEEGCRIGPIVSEGRAYFLFLISAYMSYSLSKVKDSYALVCYHHVDLIQYSKRECVDNRLSSLIMNYHQAECSME